MSRIAKRFAKLKAEGRAGLITFITAGDPDLATSAKILAGLPKAGADVIELGMPFSDPMADGPIIQAAAIRGLKAGATLRGTLGLVRDFRAEDQTTPIILMGYLNPILSYGPEAFCADAAAAGVDGLIIVDLPAEEADLLVPFARQHDIDIIRLVAPTTDDARLPHVLEGSSGFVYYISIAGITGTGTGTGSADQLAAAIPRLRAVTDLPIAIGFGIRTPAHVAGALAVADGAVVASSLISILSGTLDDDGNATSSTVSSVLAEVTTLSTAARK